VNALAVALGGALGSLLRWACGRWWPALPGEWPRATMLVNLVGCFAIGLAYGWLFERGGASEPWRLFWISGVLGGFTTWSAFALEANLLLGGGAPWRAAGYVVATVAGCLLAAWAGRALASFG
jgi:CrcB protein